MSEPFDQNERGVAAERPSVTSSSRVHARATARPRDPRPLRPGATARRVGPTRPRATHSAGPTRPRGRLAWLAASTAAALVSVGCQTPLALVGGDSVLCGDTSRIQFYLAKYAYDRLDPDAGEAVWASSKRIDRLEQIAFDPADLRDIRLVDVRSGGTSVSIGASGTGSGGPRQATAGSETDGADRWVVRMAFSRQGSARMSDVMSGIAGSYNVLALVVGDTVFTTVIEMSILGGVARIDLPSRRSKDSAISLFRRELSCPAQPPATDS